MNSLTYLLHGFIFASGSAIILYGAVINLNVLIHPADVIPPTLFSIFAFFVFVLVAYLLTRSLDAAGLIASLLILGLFHLWSVFLAVFVIAFVGLLAIRILFRKVRHSDTHRVLNTISVAIVGYYVFRFVTLISGAPWGFAPAINQPIAGVPESIPAQTAAPDIYYLILDGYGRADMLQTIHEFDNSMFIENLERRGFVIASESQSNYARTLLSLSSSLNMQYLDRMSSAMGDSNLWWPVSDAIQHSAVRSILERWGYKTVFLRITRITQIYAMGMFTKSPSHSN